MRVALTGTPGTGKTTIAAMLPYRVIDINSLVKGGLSAGFDPMRGCLQADMDALALRLDEIAGDDLQDTVVIEGHFSHHFSSKAIVLRLYPHELRLRLMSRGYEDHKVRENVEAEALDVVLVEAVEMCDCVHEIDTTGLAPEAVAAMVFDAIEGKASFPPGLVSWMEEAIFDLR